MAKGPLLNNIKKNFTTRDSLGIESVLSSISGELCPVVNTVTQRAFYWPFMCWIYYDFYKNSKYQIKNLDNFSLYLKRQDYFFVLANVLGGNKDTMYMAGRERTEKTKASYTSSHFAFDPHYLKNIYGGMQYYNAGLISMKFITRYNKDNPSKDLAFPKLTKDGERLALAFEHVIKSTSYYKNYRVNETKDVPLSTLKDYAKVIKFNLDGFDECKKIFSEIMLDNPQLKTCYEYLKYLWDKHDFKEMKVKDCRRAAFDYEDKKGRKIQLPANLVDHGHGWEIVVGRQYFTFGLEMIWKSMLENLNTPMTKSEWIDFTLNQNRLSIDINSKLSDLLETCNFSFAEREKLVENAKRKNQVEAVEKGLKLILSIHNRFKNRPDIKKEKEFLDYGNNGSISLKTLFESVDNKKSCTIKEFLAFIMDNWLIKQHYETAFEKMLQGRDGFYYEIIDDYYYRRHEFDIDFQGIRLVQFSQVLKDLGKL